ncbi:MAG: hypothetical protein Q9213_007394 [Squamulea squamosa]
MSEIANATNPGTYTYFIRLADDASSDRTATFLGNITEQVSKVCSDLANHPILSKATSINALGFSQGGQFLRAYVERCNSPAVHTLVTFGSQHNGISEFQNCGDHDWSRLVPAQYYRDPEDLHGYLENSNFLAGINNEREGHCNATYKENLQKLKKFVMYMFSEDETVVPKESAWFADYNKTSEKITWLKERRIYKEDWLGLRILDEKNRLEFRVADGDTLAPTLLLTS